jgi:UDP-N-acetylglucosamine--N-acetylmuramyl-(pentapeptide) pyrophosphoryl-undecaprenol N-acetylglucosamine transferase
VVGKAAILVPSPNVAEDHQTKNALALSTQAAAVLVKDNDAPAILIEAAISLLRDAEKQQQLSLAIRAFDKRNAAAEIAADILRRIGKEGKS